MCALDRVQKRLTIDDQSLPRLRKMGLIEGRKPNLHVSASVAKAAATQADYIRTRGRDDEFYKKQVLDYLQKFESASRMEIDKLLLDKLSDALNADQKAEKISNLLSAMRRADLIRNTGSRRCSKWVLAETMQKENGGGAE